VLGDEVAVSLPSKSFYRGMDYTDVIAPGVGFSRGLNEPGFAVMAEWNADGWGNDLTDVATRNYTTNMALAVMLDPDNYDNLGGVVLDRQWLMHDLVHDTYYQIEFQGWQQDGGGSFAYTRSQINAQTGELLNTVEFTKSAETPFDLVDTGVVISRGMQRPLNSSGVEWNGDGWSNLEDVASRDFYTNINDVRDDDWTDSQFVMHDLLSDRYYKIEIADWEQEGGGAVSYVRSEIIQQLGETGLAVGDFAIDPDTGEQLPRMLLGYFDAEQKNGNFIELKTAQRSYAPVDLRVGLQFAAYRTAAQHFGVDGDIAIERPIDGEQRACGQVIEPELLAVFEAETVKLRALFFSQFVEVAPRERATTGRQEGAGRRHAAQGLA
jgi:hypothetical protein